MQNSVAVTAVTAAAAADDVDGDDDDDDDDDDVGWQERSQDVRRSTRQEEEAIAVNDISDYLYYDLYFITKLLLSFITRG